jgi:hypothetical protein
MRTIQVKNWSDPKLDDIRTELVQESEGVWYHKATATLVLIRSELLNPEAGTNVRSEWCMAHFAENTSKLAECFG